MRGVMVRYSGTKERYGAEQFFDAESVLLYDVAAFSDCRSGHDPAADRRRLTTGAEIFVASLGGAVEGLAG